MLTPRFYVMKKDYSTVKYRHFSVFLAEDGKKSYKFFERYDRIIESEGEGENRLMQKSILLVDDIAFILEFEEKVIESMEMEMGISIRIDKANSVGEAEQLLRERDYDVAIVDMNLPDGSGSDIARMIQEQGKGTRVAALTIYPERFEEEKGSFDAYFKKPILPTVYKENLRLLLQ
jgi:CheY-like chemotaxis protein